MKVKGRIYRCCNLNGYYIGSGGIEVRVCEAGMEKLFPKLIKGMKKGQIRKITIDLKLIKPKKLKKKDAK